MTAISSLNRRFLIAGAAILAMGAGACALVLYEPALGPIAGTIAPQLYVDSVVGAQIPVHGRFVLVDATSARLYMIADGRVQDHAPLVCAAVLPLSQCSEHSAAARRHSRSGPDAVPAGAVRKP